MRKRVSFLLVLFIINTTMLSGCWNYKEINQFSIVAGIAVDKGEEDKYKLTIEIIDMHEGGREAKVQSKLLEPHGESLLDAIRNTMKITAPKLYWGHLQIVILSQEVAKEGIIEILDILCRDSEPRLSVDLLVSKEKTAKEILESQSITTEIRSIEIRKMLDAVISLSKAPKVQVYQFVNDLSGEGVSPVLPAIQTTEINAKKTSELSGTAVFSKDKLVGFLDDDETKAFLFVRNKIKDGLFVVKESLESGIERMALKVINSKTKVKPVYSTGRVSIDIEINSKVGVDEHGARGNFISEEGSLILKNAAEKEITTHINKTIQRVQKDFDLDIFGFGSIIKAEIPNLWKEIGPDWNNIFKNLNVNVKSVVEIRNSGLLAKPIKMGD